MYCHSPFQIWHKRACAPIILRYVSWLLFCWGMRRRIQERDCQSVGHERWDCATHDWGRRKGDWDSRVLSWRPADCGFLKARHQCSFLWYGRGSSMVSYCACARSFFFFSFFFLFFFFLFSFLAAVEFVIACHGKLWTKCKKDQKETQKE